MCPVAVEYIDARATTSMQTLLLQSPLYTVECDLYPGSMRRVVNHSLEPERMQSLLEAANNTADLDLHPGAMRELQKL
ncbi:hypothetical protein IWW36_002225 [Coemansia brasiliensis]|uniref:Uncharacterized protein n=1 Tax=Coemansia brasiliensis TaxID=2650707 RepID=A0A9W8M0U7_9FUNG|nr:hypothetical protein IWW36_002225 [Coemansia brasiliensis]